MRDLTKCSMKKIIILSLLAILSEIYVKAEEKSILDDAVVLDTENYIGGGYLNVISNQRYKSFIHSCLGGCDNYSEV